MGRVVRFVAYYLKLTGISILCLLTRSELFVSLPFQNGTCLLAFFHNLVVLRGHQARYFLSSLFVNQSHYFC